MSREICRPEEGHNLFPLEYRLSAGKPFPQKPRKCCLPETQASWWCHLQSTCFWSQSVPFQSMLLRDPKLDICICVYRFWEMKEFRMILSNLLFSLSWGIVVKRTEKSKDLMLVIWLKFGDLRCSNNSFEFLRIHIWFTPLLE